MSYILDAINKSEQERNEQNHVPSLHAVHETATPETNTGWIPRWLPVVLVVIGLAGAYYLYPKNEIDKTKNENQALPQAQASNNAHHIEPSAIKPSTIKPASAKDITNPIVPAKDQALSKVNTDLAGNTKTRVNSVAKPLQEEQAIEQPARQDNKTVEASSEESTLSKELPDDAPGSEYLPEQSFKDAIDIRRADKRALAKNTGQRETAHKETLALLNNKPLSNEVASTTTAENTIQDEEQIVDPKIPLITELPSEIKKSIPDINFNAHVYSENQGGGFVILNGLSRSEGNQIAVGLFIDKILEDSVILSYHGTQFKLLSMKSWVNR